jgi:ATP-dependent helicase HrpB
LQKFDKSKAKTAILEAIAEDGEFLLDFNEDVEQLIFRIQSLKSWNPEQDWPSWSVQSLCLESKNWLEPYLDQVSKNEDLKKLDLHTILLHSLSFEHQKQLNELAPAKLSVPSGSLIPIHYKSNGETPLLSVRLQELFGLLETPRVNAGQVPVLIELLSPGYKPVQLTQDLKSFWANGYFEVKKELKRRYPKHEWPEDPISAEAVRGVKRKG